MRLAPAYKLRCEALHESSSPKAIVDLAPIATALSALPSADFGKLISEETEKWGKVVRFSAAKAE
jgi:hypothetical protein